MLTGRSLSALPHNLSLRILDGSPDAILICDRTGTVRYWNDESRHALRWAEALGTRAGPRDSRRHTTFRSSSPTWWNGRRPAAMATHGTGEVDQIGHATDGCRPPIRAST